MLIKMSLCHPKAREEFKLQKTHLVQIQPQFFSTHALVEEKAHKSAWVACAYNLHSLLLYIIISQGRTHGIPLAAVVGGGMAVMISTPVSPSEVIKFTSTSSTAVSMATARCCVPTHLPPNSTCKPRPRGRAERHLLTFSPCGC